MNSFNSGLSELFPGENFSKMGCGKNILNDDLSDIFKQVQPFSCIDADIITSDAEDVGTLSFNESEIQDHGIFDFLEDPCFKEPSNYSSLLSLDSDDLLLNGEPSKFCSSLQSNTSGVEVFSNNVVDSKSNNNVSESKNNAVLQEEEEDSENRDSCIHKIVDILATFVDESSHQGELTFNRDVLDHPQECFSSLSNEALFSNKSRERKSVASSICQVTDLNDDLILGDNYLLDEFPNSVVEDTLMKTIALTNLQTAKDNNASCELLNESCFKIDDSAACRPIVNDKLQSHQDQKCSRQLLLPYLTEFCCTFCHPKTFFLSKEDLLQHEKKHKSQVSKKRSFECKDCNSTFPNSITYWNHVRKHQKQKCEICLKEFAAGSFKNHLAVHDKSLRLICEYCGLDFVSKIKLNEHLSLHKNVKLYVCKLCNRNFSNHGSYWIHKKWHQSPFPYKCNCGMSFRHSSILANHRSQNKCSPCLTSENSGQMLTPQVSELSTNTNSVGLEENNSLSSSSLLSAKINNIENVDSKNLKIAISRFPKKIHKCEFCERIFPTTTSLAVHRLKHTKERPFKCERCLKDFPLKNSLMKHKSSAVACDRHLKKQLSQCEVPTSISSIKILPQSDPNKLHCPHCNINFPNIESFVIHFCKKAQCNVQKEE